MRAVLSNNVGKKKCATSLCIKNLVQTNEVLKWTAALITSFGQEQVKIQTLHYVLHYELCVTLYYITNKTRSGLYQLHRKIET